MEIGISLSKYFKEQNKWDDLLKLGAPRVYQAGDVLYMQGEKNVGLICLKKGKIKNCMYFANGTEKTTCILEAPSITGETSVIDNGGTLSCAVALTEVEAQVIPTEETLAFFEKNPDVMAVMLRFYAKKIRSVQLQADSVVLSVPQKLARMLVNFDAYGVFSADSDPQIHVTHEQLASFLGTTRPKITSALNTFEQAHFIRKGRGTIEILDYDGLRAIFE